MTGNGKHTTYKNGDDWGMVNIALFSHITCKETGKLCGIFLKPSL